MNKDYITQDELKYSLELTDQNFANADLSAAITAASRAIDDACYRRFYLDDDASQVRYYTPATGQYVAIDDLVTLTTLKTDDAADGAFEHTWAVNTDFLLTPMNAPADNKPYTAIQRHPLGLFYLYPNYPRVVEVTGQFGWPTVPDAIKLATKILAAKLFRRPREAPFGVVGAGLDGTAVRLARTDPDVSSLIGPYIRSRSLIL